VYDDLLRSGELTEVEWFNAGVGLYGADQYELAAKAFRKAIEANPYARDALYNLGQAIYAAASAAEEQRAASPESGKAAIGDRIRAFYEELHAVAERIRELDPNFRNALLMMAQAERSLADLAADPATAKPWQDRAVATLEQAESMPFDVDAVEMSVSEGMATVSGRVTNHTLAASRSVVLEFTLIGEGGAGVATQQVTVTAGEAESATPFTFAAKVDRPVLGWKYRVVS
jgi:tetratricopeptide (TPR) repeat protein